MSAIKDYPPITPEEFAAAGERMKALQRSYQVLRVAYDRDADRIRLELANGLEVAFPPKIAQGLDTATAEQLEEVELSPSGLGLHFESIDADIYVPTLMQGVFGNRAWMAAQLGREGGLKTSPAKAEAARENGKRGGRPRKKG